MDAIETGLATCSPYPHERPVNRDYRIPGTDQDIRAVLDLGRGAHSFQELFRTRATTQWPAQGTLAEPNRNKFYVVS